MSAVVDSLSFGLAATGALVLASAFTLGAQWRAAVSLALEFWTAAGLLSLAGEPSWARIGTVAAIIALRELQSRSRAPAPA